MADTSLKSNVSAELHIDRVVWLDVFRCNIDDRGHSLDREASFTDHLGGTARGKKTDILLNQTLGQVKQTSLVIDGDDSCWKRKRNIISMVVGGGPQTTVK